MSDKALVEFSKAVYESINEESLDFILKNLGNFMTICCRNNQEKIDVVKKIMEVFFNGL